MPVRRAKNIKEILSDEAEASRTTLTPYTKEYQIKFEHIATGKTVKFLAFLTQFGDSFRSNWKTENVYGRMDPLAVFQNTQRTLSIGWSIPSEGVMDGANNLTKIRDFIRMLYPVYEEGSLGVSGIKAAPLIRLHFVNLAAEGLTGLVGVLSGIDFAPDLEAGFFDHRTKEKGERLLYPKSIKLNCTLQVLHTKKVGWVGKKFAGGKNSAFPYSVDKTHVSEWSAAAEARNKPRAESSPLAPTTEAMFRKITKGK